ncbi:hypothetical protein D3C72_1289140 [compost metagenome]
MAQSKLVLYVGKGFGLAFLAASHTLAVTHALTASTEARSGMTIFISASPESLRDARIATPVSKRCTVIRSHGVYRV